MFLRQLKQLELAASGKTAVNRKSVMHWLSIFILAGMMVLIPLCSTRADTGPKPTMNFSFIYKINGTPEIISGILQECSDANCADGESLKQLGPQHFECSPSSCSSMAYGYSKYQRLVLEFSDGVTRTSNVFSKAKFAADYEVSVYADHLEVVEQPGGPNWPVTGSTILDLLLGLGFLCLTTANLVALVMLAVRAGMPEATFKSMPGWYIAGWILAVPTLLISLILTRGLVPTLVVELMLGAVYAIFRKHPLILVLTFILLLNLITQPALWLTVSGFSGHYSISLVLFSELVVWLVEAGGLCAALRNRIGFGEALIISLVLNTASFGIGLLLPF